MRNINDRGYQMAHNCTVTLPVNFAEYLQIKIAAFLHFRCHSVSSWFSHTKLE